MGPGVFFFPQWDGHLCLSIETDTNNTHAPPNTQQDFRLRQAGRAPPRRALPYADEAECSYGWRTVGGSGSRGLSLRGGPGGGRGGGSLGRRVGHLRSGVVGSGWGGGWPIDYDEPVGGEAVRYRCRARLARGGRIVFDRVPLLQTQHQPAAAAATAATATPAAPQQEKTAAAAAAASASSSSMPPPPAPGGPQPAQHQHLHLSHPHPPSYRPLPAESITVALCAAPSLGPHLDKYPTCDLQSGDVFRYPTRFPEILKVDDAEDEVVERDPLAPSDPDPLLVLPPKPRPPETDSVALLRFQLRV